MWYRRLRSGSGFSGGAFHFREFFTVQIVFAVRCFDNYFVRYQKMKRPGAKIARADPKKIFTLILKLDGPGRFEGVFLFHFGNNFEAYPPQAQPRQIHRRQNEDDKAGGQQNNF